jgi:hypothetical protein
MFAIPIATLIFGSKYSSFGIYLRDVNLIIGTIYVCDFIGRMILYKIYHATKKKFLYIDISIALFQLYVICSLYFDNNYVYSDIGLWCIKIIAVLRFIRLIFSFPYILKFVVVFMCSIGEIIPLFIFGAVVVFLFGVLGMACEWNVDHTLLFPAKSYGFRNLSQACITLLAFGSSNSWSTIMAMCDRVDIFYALPRALSSTIMKLYFFLFYIFTVIFLQSFALILCIRYQNVISDTCGLAYDEIEHFRATWRDIFLFKPKLNLVELCKLLRHLDQPLGKKMKKGEIYPFSDFYRFVKTVIMNIPYEFEAKRIKSTIFRKKNFMHMKYSELPYQENYLEDFTTLPTNTKFTFGQILIAVHRVALLDSGLIDDTLHAERRAISQKYLTYFKYHIGRELIKMNQLLSNDERAQANILMMQRVNIQLYRLEFSKTLLHAISTLQYHIESTQLNSFYTYCIKRLSNLLEYELHSAQLKLKYETSLRKLSVGRTKIADVNRLSQCSKYVGELQHLQYKINNLIKTYGVVEWHIETEENVCMIQEEKNIAITSITIDDSNNIFIGTNTGFVNIYSCVSENNKRNTSNKNRGKFNYNLKQNIKVGNGKISALAVLRSGTQLLVAMDSILYLYIAASDPTNKGKYVQTIRLAVHRGQVNSITFTSRYFISCGSDGACMMWKFNSADPMRVCKAGFALNCCTILYRTANDMMVQDHFRHTLICGGANGRLVLLPLLHSGSKAPAHGITDEEYNIEAWNNPLVAVAYKKSSVTAVECAWGLIYTGSSDGEIKIWMLSDLPRTAVTGNKSCLYRNLVALVLLDSKAVHADTVSRITFAGNYMFTSSYDLSVISWPSPERHGSRFGFKQLCNRGVVSHTSRILSMDSNNSLLVTGDDIGTIIVRSCASKSTTIVPDNNFELFHYSTLKFSFIKYDFGECCVGILGGKEILYQTSLLITNTSSEIHKIRCSNAHISSLIIETHDATGIFDSGYNLMPYSSITILFSFVPLESQMYKFIVPMIIDEITARTVTLVGSGVRPVLSIEGGMSSYDFGAVAVHSRKSFTFTLVNECDAPLTVELMDVLGTNQFDPYSDELSDDEDTQEEKYDKRNDELEAVTVIVQHHSHNNKKESKFKSLSQIGIKISPHVLTLTPYFSATIEVEFCPTQAISSFDLPIRAAFRGNCRTILNVTGRSKVVRDMDNNGESDIFSEPLDKKGSEIEMVNYQISRLSESLSPGVLCNRLSTIKAYLSRQGWSINSTLNTSVILNRATGFFVELFDPTKSLSDGCISYANPLLANLEKKNKKPLVCVPQNIIICVHSSAKVSIEVWYHDSKLAEIEGQSKSH